MTRPAITPSNIRRQSTPAKILRTIGNWIAAIATAMAIAVVFVHIFDPALNPYL